MDEKLNMALSELINTALSGVDATKEFLVAELPDVVQQLLLWYMARNFLFFVGGIVVLIAVICGLQIVYRKAKNEVGYGEDLFFIMTIASIVSTVPVILTFMMLLNMEWLKIWIAPKIWLIEYAGSLIK